MGRLETVVRKSEVIIEKRKGATWGQWRSKYERKELYKLTDRLNIKYKAHLYSTRYGVN